MLLQCHKVTYQENQLNVLHIGEEIAIDIAKKTPQSLKPCPSSLEGKGNQVKPINLLMHVYM